MKRAKLMPPKTIRLESDVQAAIEELAEDDSRSFSAYVNIVLRHHAVAEGKIKGQKVKRKK